MKKSGTERISFRDSNIELLRILCMAMIVAHHLFAHGCIFEQSGSNMPNLLWGGVLLPGGKIGYDCFIIITAWFCTGKEFKGSRLMKIALEVVFYNLVGIILAEILNNGQIEPITMRNWLGCFFPVFGISHGFAVYYMIFLMILPLLNTVSERMSKRNIQAIIVLMFMMQIGAKVLSVIIDYSTFVDLDNGMFTFIILYFAVVYVKRWPVKIVEKRYILVLAFLVIWLFNAFANIFSLLYPEMSILKMALIVINHDVSPLNMIAGFCMFFFFKGLSIKHSSIINFTASHTFGILLLHDHNYFRYVIWERVFFVENFYDADLPILIAYTAAVVIAIFAVGIIVDTVREYLLEKPITKTKIYLKACSGLERCFKLQSAKGDV